jgi:hypothetical protein
MGWVVEGAARGIFYSWAELGSELRRPVRASGELVLLGALGVGLLGGKLRGGFEAVAGFPEAGGRRRVESRL